RQSGIILFFSLSYIAQLCFLYHLSQHQTHTTAFIRQVFKWQQNSAIVLLGIGIASVVLDLNYAAYDDIEDAFEWVMMLFIVGQFCSHYFLWKAVDLRLDLGLGSRHEAP